MDPLTLNIPHKFWNSIKSSDSGSLRSLKITKHHFLGPDPPLDRLKYQWKDKQTNRQGRLLLTTLGKPRIQNFVYWLTYILGFIHEWWYNNKLCKVKFEKLYVFFPIETNICLVKKYNSVSHWVENNLSLHMLQ